MTLSRHQATASSRPIGVLMAAVTLAALGACGGGSTSEVQTPAIATLRTAQRARLIVGCAA